jgi:DNA-binding response OmpR family regulator
LGIYSKIPGATLTDQKDRILFVDDDAELRAIVREQLTNVGYEVDEAEDGVVAMEKMQRGEYRVLLLDITMPGTSGLDVLKRAKQTTPGCHVIMLTGVVGLSVAIESLKLGADDYITKPYNLEYLLNSIKRALRP